MPDKHEVGGSTPLEPTSAAKAARRKRRKEAIRMFIRSISEKSGEWLDSTWAHQRQVAVRQKGHWKLNKEEKRTDNFEISEKELNKKVFQEIVVKKLQLNRDSKESRRKTKKRRKSFFIVKRNYLRNSSKREVQAKKSIRWMPWHQEPTKDVTSCEKPRGAANKPRSADVRIGEPHKRRACDHVLNT